MNTQGYMLGYLFKIGRDVAKLPYRPTAEAFLRDEKGNVVAFVKQKPGSNQSFLKMPGGGIDPEESPEEGVAREIEEETGITPKNLRLVEDVRWDWPKSWAMSDKQKERYKKFRGEHSHLFVGEVGKKGKPTSQEGDAWDEVPSTSPEDARKEIETSLNPKSKTYQGEGYSPYKRAQLRALLISMQENNKAIL
jgi:8-oxo-dGTP pyrophosphatase MutT (NUDIX family)